MTTGMRANGRKRKTFPVTTKTENNDLKRELKREKEQNAKYLQEKNNHISYDRKQN